MKKLMSLAVGTMFIATAAFAQSPQQNQQQGTVPQQNQQQMNTPQQRNTPPLQHQNQNTMQQSENSTFPQQNKNQSILPQQKEQLGNYPARSGDTIPGMNKSTKDTSFKGKNKKAWHHKNKGNKMHWNSKKAKKDTSKVDTSGVNRPAIF